MISLEYVSTPLDRSRADKTTGGVQSVAPVPKKIRVLLLEDSAVDAELILIELRRSGFDPVCQHVEKEDDFVASLDPRLDIILADYNVPNFGGLDALRRIQQLELDIPFIIISGTLGDERAAQCIKEGVSDYLLKDRLERLGMAVSHAMDEKRLRIERKQFEEQQRQSQKMEAIGQLAGGIAHDFNNMLTVINGRVDLLLETETFSAETRDSLQQIFTAGQRAASLTRQLLFFSHKRPIESRPVDLNEVIGDVTEMLRRLIGANIELVLRLGPGLPPIEADISMLEQVLINLAVNARDAMGRSGRLLIETEAVELTEVECRGTAHARAGHFACLSVQDTGCGIPPEVLPRIFDPFFTTKEAGKGTGLGLATLFGVVKQHKGWCDVETEVGVGTTFKVYLPIETSGERPVAKPDGKPATIGRGRETVLVVEDDNSVRDYTVAVLQPYGYRVLQARSGVDALEVWKNHSIRIDLLVTDIVMPDDMSGPELAARLRAEKPGLGVIFTSGYSLETMGQIVGPQMGSRFMHKPFQPRALAMAVREVLDARMG